MSSLSREEKDLILDFYFHCGDDDKINKGRDLVAANPDAAVLYAHLGDTLTQLDSIKYEPCPENLVDLTVARLKLAASSGHTQLHKLLEFEQQKPSDTHPIGVVSVGDKTYRTMGLRQNLLKVTAMAAMILVAASIGWPTLTNMRFKAMQTACANSQRRLGAGIGRYAKEHDGQLPLTSAGLSGSTDQGAWNTTAPFGLIKGGYVSAEDFICAGSKYAKPLTLTTEQINKLNDFPSRCNSSFSIRVRGEKAIRLSDGSQCILLSDRSPVFEDCYTTSSTRTNTIGQVRVNEELLKRLSSNHNRKGQNLLFGDGSVRFMKVRVMGDDDIYTIKGVLIYKGQETPREPEDVFLAP